MRGTRTSAFRRIGRVIVGAAAGALLAAASAGSSAARAAQAPGSPVFSSPLDVSNPFLPFVPGAVKVYAGREERGAVIVVENHLAETRTFDWDGSQVECRVVEQIKFVRGAPESHERFFVAQADDGSVWGFGEVEDTDPTDDGGDDKGEPGGWIVGQLRPGDPADLLTGGEPAMLMPASPRRGDEWRPENLPPDLLKRSRAVTTQVAIRAAGAKHRGCLRVVERDLADGTSEVRVHAPGLGLIRTREAGEQLTLQASTIRRAR